MAFDFNNSRNRDFVVNNVCTVCSYCGRTVDVTFTYDPTVAASRLVFLCAHGTNQIETDWITIGEASSRSPTFLRKIFPFKNRVRMVAGYPIGPGSVGGDPGSGKIGKRIVVNLDDLMSAELWLPKTENPPTSDPSPTSLPTHQAPKLKPRKITFED